MYKQNNTKTSATTAKHPSGLTWERWKQPFKMPHERKMIQQWLQRKKELGEKQYEHYGPNKLGEKQDEHYRPNRC